MRQARVLQVAAAIGLLGAVLSTPAGADARDLSRDTLPANDGWAFAGGGKLGCDNYATGTGCRTLAQRSTPKGGGEGHPVHSGPEGRRGKARIALSNNGVVGPTAGRAGSQACGGHVRPTLTGRQRPVKQEPKVVPRSGADRNLLPSGRRGRQGLKKYLAAYDPCTWGSAKPSGPQEAAKQAERVVLPVGSNTTILGLGSGAVLKGASLQVRQADNVIVRNLELRDAYDCFPVWQPNSGGLGDWKTAYDTLWLNGATHVWVDHVTASDKGHADADEPTYFARNYLRHDGLLDITNASDLVTVSWSKFADHDKAMLIGSGDTATGDRGKLRVTLHHNEFRSVTQRAPRVRFGQVHLYNNRYLIDHGDDYRYSVGVSTESAVYAENNAFTTPGHVEAADLVKSWNGTALHQTGTLFNGFPVDLLTIHNAYNSGSERDLTADVGWTPTLHTKIDSADTADREVARGAGAGRHT
ncbi:pectate lyase [Streptomyces sp. ME02-8801-2C]|uniref:pectate lyase family protein n=1 Tax=Streptomyces sp. ME02-8801-2C TaxID=3028680 RepID=UPI0029B270FA|nr:pectate lyase [Streptomyces sp. ME02-8801-2C]MDX3450627.1 pectate lyase [Streptomyces sp. ME02-8801-2C]